MTLVEIISFLRQSVSIQDKEVTPVNPEYLALSDSDITLILELALSKVQPDATLTTLDNEYLYPLILMAKKEVYHRLALPKAQKYSISVSGGARLNKNQIFDHYMTLIDEIEKDYKTYLSTGIPVKSAEVYLSSRYYTRRNYNNATPPIINLNADNIYNDRIELSWGLSKISKFNSYTLYIGETPNIDAYAKDNQIASSAVKVDTFFDIHQTKYRIENLKPNTTYYVTIEVKECNGLKGYSEITVTTLV